MPLQRRIPKRGFTSRSHVDYQVVNLRDFSRLESDQVTPESLRSNGLIRSLRKPVKILGMGDVDRPFTVRVHAVSETARSKIEGQGGTVALLGDEAKE
jgi:large subunit ribosomal protein L15